MRVLFISNYRPSFLKGQDITYGGWASSLINCIIETGVVQVGWAYPSNTTLIPDGEIKYYPIKKNVKNKLKRKVFSIFFLRHCIYTLEDKIIINGSLNVIEEFKPDIIHIWGSEFAFGLVAKYTKTPVILHIQGILNPYFDAFFPPGINLRSLFNIGTIKSFIKYKREYYQWKNYKVPRELEIYHSIKYVIGRTDWDHNVISVINPNIKYYIGNEMLRPLMINSQKWKFHTNREKLIITSTVSDTLYKGVDVILKAAFLIKKNWGNNFIWNIYGISNAKVFERNYGLKAKKVNVSCNGIVDIKTLLEKLLESDVYCHSSYIENSPNSICEAQYIGLPVVAVDGGGTASLLKKGSGILIPSNDAYQISYYILRLKKDNIEANFISNNEIKIAEERHNSQKIVSNLIKIYEKVIDNESIIRSK